MFQQQGCRCCPGEDERRGGAQRLGEVGGGRCLEEEVEDTGSSEGVL